MVPTSAMETASNASRRRWQRQDMDHEDRHHADRHGGGCAGNDPMALLADALRREAACANLAKLCADPNLAQPTSPQRAPTDGPASRSSSCSTYIGIIGPPPVEPIEEFHLKDLLQDALTLLHEGVEPLSDKQLLLDSRANTAVICILSSLHTSKLSLNIQEKVIYQVLKQMKQVTSNREKLSLLQTMTMVQELLSEFHMAIPLKPVENSCRRFEWTDKPPDVSTDDWERVRQQLRNSGQKKLILMSNKMNLMQEYYSNLFSVLGLHGGRHFAEAAVWYMLKDWYHVPEYDLQWLNLNRQICDLRWYMKETGQNQKDIEWWTFRFHKLRDFGNRTSHSQLKRVDQEEKPKLVNYVFEVAMSLADELQNGDDGLAPKSCSASSQGSNPGD